VTGKVNVSGLFSDIDASAGNGVRWYVTSGSKKLAQGIIANGARPQDFLIKNVKVTKDQMLYFIVDATSCYHADDTTLDVLITVAK